MAAIDFPQAPTNGQQVTHEGRTWVFSTGHGWIPRPSTLAANAVGATQLNVSGNGTDGQALLSDGDGSMRWGTVASSYNLPVATTTLGGVREETGADIDVNATGGMTIKNNAVDASALNVSGSGTVGQVLASDGDGSMSWVRDFSASIKGLSASGGPDIGSTLLGEIPGNLTENSIPANQEGLLPVPHPNQSTTPSGTGEVSFTPLSTDSTFRCDLAIGFGWNNTSSGNRTFHAFLLRKIGSAAETIVARVSHWVNTPQQGGDISAYTFYVDAPNTTSTVRYKWAIMRAKNAANTSPYPNAQSVSFIECPNRD